MKCENCKGNFAKLIYKESTKKWLCPQCTVNHEKANNPRKENIFIVHQAIKRKGAPML